MNPLYAAGGVLIVACGIGGYIAGHKSANDDWQTKWNAEQSRIVKLQLDHETAMREKEQFYSSEIQRINQDAKSAMQALQVDVANGSVAADGLREQVRKYAANAKQCANSRNSTGGKAAGTNIDLLADMHDSMEKHGRALAEEADRRRIAGMACEQWADKVRQENNRKEK